MDTVTTWHCQEHLFDEQDRLADANKEYDSDPRESHRAECETCGEWGTVYPLTRWAD